MTKTVETTTVTLLFQACVADTMRRLFLIGKLSNFKRKVDELLHNATNNPETENRIIVDTPEEVFTAAYMILTKLDFLIEESNFGTIELKNNSVIKILLDPKFSDRESSAYQAMTYIFPDETYKQ